MTHLEDLSNELIFEILDFLDGYDILMAFSHLSVRFQDLLMCSYFRLKLKFQLISKPEFQQRCVQVIAPNTHRLVSLCLSNCFIIDHFFSMFTLDSSFIHLESLALNGMTTDKLVPLLTRLVSLPRLFSLSIDLGDSIKRKVAVYRLIFRLPVLKYGKFFLEFKHELSDLTIPDNNLHETSSIEYFITNAYCRLHQFANLLSYTPRLRHFSCAYLSAFKSRLPKVPITSLNLVHLYIDDCLLSFVQLESFVVKFCLRLKVLRLSIRRDETYLDADRWQRLISFHLRHLQTFDFEHSMWVYTKEALDAYHTKIDQFSSSFWRKRKWFFAHQHHATYSAGATKFYSTQPYRYERSRIDF
jgi:hypothetical protein